jgi:hypothetical protein
MYLKFLIFLFVICNIAKPLKAQSIEEARQAAKEDIKKLKESQLLVRLHTNQNQYGYLNAIGKKKEAERIKKLQEEFNKRVIKSFNTHFNFCPVLFFYVENTPQLKEGKVERIFLNENLEVTENYVFNDSLYYIGEFGTTDEDTAKVFSGYRMVRTDSGTVEKVATYTSGSGLGVSAFVIRNMDFYQLIDPFPYIRSFKGLPLLESSPETTVRKLDTKLKELYEEFY